MPARPLQRRQGSRRIVETTARGFRKPRGRRIRFAFEPAGIPEPRRGDRKRRQFLDQRSVADGDHRDGKDQAADPQGQPVAFVDMGELVRDRGQRFVVAGKIDRIVANHRRPARKRERVGAERRRAAKTDRRNRIDAVAPGENARGGGDAPPPDRRNAARTKQRSVHSVERSPFHLRFQAFGNQDDGEIGRERNRGAQSENARDRQEGDRL